MSAFHSNMLLGSVAETADLGDPIEQSLRFNGAEYLNLSVSSAYQSKGTLSFWMKAGKEYSGDAYLVGFNNYGVGFGFGSSNYDLTMVTTSGNSDGVILRDPSAWYHVVCTDSAVYINGKDVSLSYSYPRLDVATGNLTIGCYNSGLSSFWTGYLAEMHFVDGQDLDPTKFGKYNNMGVWVPKTPSISNYGTNGFHLTFDPSQTNGIGHDSSGRNNHFSATGFSTTAGFNDDVVNDTPTSNYATLNPVVYPVQTISDGNLTAGNQNPYIYLATQVPDYPYYWESIGSNYYYGIASNESVRETYLGYHEGQLGVYVDGSMWYNSKPSGNNGSVGSISGFSYTTTDHIMQAYDPATGKYWIGKNGTWAASGNPATGANPAYTVPADYRAKMVPSSNVSANTSTHNYGQQTFSHTVPSGFKGLVTENISEPSIKDGSDHFRAIAAGPNTGVGAGELGGNWSTFLTPESGSWLASAGYDATGAFEGNAGNGAFPSACPSGTGPVGSKMTFAPETDVPFTTLEVYMPNAGQNALFDGQWTSVTNSSWTQVATNGTINKTTPLVMYANTGVYAYCQGIRINGNQILVDSGPLAAAQAAFPDGLWWIKDKDNSNQHQLVDSLRGNTVALYCPGGTQRDDNYAGPTGNSVAWCWNWNSSDPQENGFNIVEDTSTSVGTPDPYILDTGLNSPDMVIFNMDSVPNVLHSSLDGMMQLHNDSAVLPYATGYGIQANGTIKVDGSYKNGKVICYAWQAVPGYSAFGSYIGNSNADGPFVYTGFRPAFVLYKGTSNYRNWHIRDSTRSEYNPAEHTLYPNKTDAEPATGNTGNYVDLLSNGFKIRNGDGDQNMLNETYIYAAFAENPFGGENTAPVPAR